MIPARGYPTRRHGDESLPTPAHGTQDTGERRGRRDTWRDARSQALGYVGLAGGPGFFSPLSFRNVRSDPAPSPVSFQDADGARRVRCAGLSHEAAADARAFAIVLVLRCPVAARQ